MNGKGGWLVNLVTLLGIAVGGVWWLSTELHALELRLVAIEAQGQDRWTATDQYIWSDRAGRALKVDLPDPLQVRRDRQDRGD